MSMFREGEFVVYPAHGVGRLVGLENKEVMGQHIELFVIDFPRDKMTLRLPSQKARTAGLRHPSSSQIMEKALMTLKGRSKIKRIVWNRRSHEYESKINSGDPCSIAEVVRELACIAVEERSYSENLFYEAARTRLGNELAIVYSIDMEKALEMLDQTLKGMPQAA
jgi:CarD family transcriptional regulator